MRVASSSCSTTTLRGRLPGPQCRTSTDATRHWKAGADDGEAVARRRKCVFDSACGCWVGSVDIGRDPDTGRRRHRKVSASNRTECKAKLDVLRDEKRRTGTVGRRDITVRRTAAAGQPAAVRPVPDHSARPLRWRDVDLDARAIRVRTALVEREGGRREMGELKTDRSRRTMVMPRAVASALRAQQAVDRVRMGKYYEDLDLVFCRPEGVPWSRCGLQSPTGSERADRVVAFAVDDDLGEPR